MLRKLKLTGVGELPNGEYLFGKRFNVFTGDNGLGKTFMLDTIWYALTRRWLNDVNPQLMYGYMAQPSKADGAHKIQFDLDTPANIKVKDYTVAFKFDQQAWVGRPGRPYSPGLVIYAHADGGFSIWDPARNYWVKKGNIDAQEREPAFVFSNHEVWNGQYKFASGGGDSSAKTTCLIQGLLSDLALWQSNSQSKEFPILSSLLRTISPENFTLKFGELTKFSLDDARNIPTVNIGYGDVPVLWASSAIKRVLALAYILVWSFSKHVEAARFLRLNPSSQVTLLFDELDAHLHPKWQSTIMNALSGCVKNMMQAFAGEGVESNVQIIASTHSPIVMTSLEDIFDKNEDRWFDFDYATDGSIKISCRDFINKGTSDGWLESEAFDMPSTYSPVTNALISEAENLLENEERISNKIPRLREILVQLASRLPDGNELVYRLDQILKDINRD